MATANCKMINFFDEKISTKDFAKYMRRLMYATVTLHLQNEEQLHKEWIEDGFYHLTQFVEEIDPQLGDVN